VQGAKCVEAKKFTQGTEYTRNSLPVVKHWQKISSPGHITKHNLTFPQQGPWAFEKGSFYF
jgi:hypothetical protein